MRLDLGPIGVINARSIIMWCHEHGVDAERSAELADLWSNGVRWQGRRMEEQDMFLEVPEHYLTFFRIKGWL